MSIELFDSEPVRLPWTTMYAWEISHALATLYHPYYPEPSALTEYLKQKLRKQWAKHLSRSHPAQVKQNIQPEHNSEQSSILISL